MLTTLYQEAPPPDQVVHQVLEMVATYISDLSMLAVRPSNHLYAVYRWALPCEVDLYIRRIGQVPAAPVELIVAFDDTSPADAVGFLLYLPVPTHPDACGITYMAVKQSHRRHGIGTAMMREVITRYPHVELTCPVKKVPFYEQLGFNVINTEKTQVVMNTRSASTTGLMGIVDVGPIYSSPQVQEIHEQLLRRWGLKEMATAEKQLERHREQLMRQSASYVHERLSAGQVRYE